MAKGPGPFRGLDAEFWEQEQGARLRLCKQEMSLLLHPALDLGENERVKMPL